MLTEAIVKRALTGATVLWDQKLVLFFMERLGFRPQRADDGLIKRLEDLESRVEALEQQI